MQVFEFHFNPRAREDLIFDSFCYEPENVYEKRLGSLYMVGELRNALPQNFRFLDRLSKLLKEKYYSLALTTPEKSLKESLRTVNESLEKIAKGGDVSWLGNLNFAVLSLKNFELNLTKVGDLKILLLREGQVIDIGKNLEFEEIEPYPLKIFSNIASGKLTESDKILILTKEVSEAFQNSAVKTNSTAKQNQNHNLLNEIAGLDPFNEKELKRVLNGKGENLSKISGICFLVVLSPEVLPKETITFVKKTPEFSFRRAFSPTVSRGKNIFIHLGHKVGKWRPAIPKFPWLKLKPLLGRKTLWLGEKIPSFKKLPQIKVPKNLKKNGILVLALVFLLFLGFLIASKEKEQQLIVYQATFVTAQEKVDQAENFLICKKEIEANSLFKEAWEEILPLANIAPTLPPDFREQVLSLSEKVSKNLNQLNKLTEISEPTLLFEFEAREFIPQKIVSINNSLYFFSPYSQNLFKVNQNGEGQLIPTENKFNLAVSIASSTLFFSKPNQLINLKDDKLSEPIFLETPYPDFNFDDLSSYRSNLYFLDQKSAEIIKYPYLENLKWDSPQLWLSPQSKATGAKSMAIDGNIWILNKDNSIGRYHFGKLQKNLIIELFPEQKNFSKIFTASQLPYLYLLEPEQNRIIILNKTGGIIEQFQSDKFDGLLDFSVSKDGKTIYLLNALKVYQIKF